MRKMTIFAVEYETGDRFLFHKGYGTALLKHLREIQGNRPIALPSLHLTRTMMTTRVPEGVEEIDEMAL